MLAQAQAAMYQWMQRESQSPFPDDQVAEMVERFHKMFVRTLRSLSNLRKVPLAVVVQNVGQVNVAGQQVNLSSAVSKPSQLD
jgi:hypothetical protein